MHPWGTNGRGQKNKQTIIRRRNWLPELIDYKNAPGAGWLKKEERTAPGTGWLKRTPPERVGGEANSPWNRLTEKRKENGPQNGLAGFDAPGAGWPSWWWLMAVAAPISCTTQS